MIAALLAAISPAMVFYSRYFIHETLLVVFSFGALLAACRYLRAPGAGPALLAGASAGLMLATKETAPLALGCMLLALALTHLVARWRGESPPPIRSVVSGRHVLLALLAAVVVSATLFSSFLGHPRGIVDAARAYGLYLDRAGAATWHFHPWPYYLGLLIHFPSSGTPFWTEGLILVLAMVGGAAGWVGEGSPRDGFERAPVPRLLHAADARHVLRDPVQDPLVPARVPARHDPARGRGRRVPPAGSLRSAATRAMIGVLLLAGAAHLGWQAFSGSFRFAADPRNPYVYAHTGTDVFEIVGRLQDLARAHPDGSSMPVQVISRENLWPLPWYLRGLARVAVVERGCRSRPRTPRSSS